MKRLFALSLAVMLFASIAKAQNSSYVDDRYYSGSEAEQDANTSAKQNKNQQNGTAVQQYDASSGYYDDNNGNVSDDGYIDYDDDSYTTRINRFYYPMGMSYWGSVYSPYYNDPFWYNPYYSWGGFYPGLSMSFGFGGPYWSSCWAYNAWYGYGGFYPYYAWGGYPYNYGGSYGLDYWNGYYDGFYANNYYHNNYYGLGNTVYGARGNRSMVGNYTRSRLAQVNNSNRMVTPFSARKSGNALSINNGNVRGRNASGQPVRGQSFQGNSNERIVLKGNAQRVQNNGTVNNSNQRVFRQESQATGNNANRRSNGFLGGVFSGNRNTYAPNNSGRSYDVQRTQPARSYERSEPARSYSQPSRSSSSFESSRSSSSFGGSRSSGGGGSRSFSRGR